MLGPLGAALVAAEAGVELADLSWRRTLAHDLAASQRLAHLVGLNGFFTALLRSARTRPGCDLDRVVVRAALRPRVGRGRPPRRLRRLDRARHRLPFLLEYDNGTERLDRLAAKLAGYARLAAAAGHPNWVLFTFPGPRREADARRVLAHPDVPVATAARTPGAPPTPPSGCPVASSGRRLRLAELATPRPRGVTIGR